MIFLYVTLFMTLHAYTQAQFNPMGLSPSMSMQMPMGMPPMPVQMPIGGPPQMPMVVMPYHSRTADKFRRKPKPKPKRPRKLSKRPNYYDSDSDSDSESSSSSTSSSSSDEKNFRAHKDREGHKRRRQVLTPVVSYVTKDGYVVYQKKIKKERAKDWLELGKNADNNEADNKESGIDEFEARNKIRKKHRSKSHH